MRTAYDIIIKPVITEASMDNMQKKKYTFKVMEASVMTGFMMIS